MDLETILTLLAAGVVAPLVTQHVKRKRWSHTAVRALCVGLGGATGLLVWGLMLIQWMATRAGEAPELLAMLGAGLLAGGGATGAVAGWKAVRGRRQPSEVDRYLRPPRRRR